MRTLELLAPAGSPEALLAAVQSGANAVYLGYGDFNARRNAKNFSKEELSEAIAYCHLRGVKVYLTLNTLLTDRELKKAAETAETAALCGVDAILVQDLGVLRLLKESVPDVPLHASTQMTIHNLPGVLFCESLGITRVVLSRELSRSAIANLCAKSPLELEVFTHGALCMGYSGQCYFSSLVGGRSGNRGLCAQPCRLAYRWEQEQTPSYPLSLKDLSLADYLNELRELGVACLKLEGRMKRPEYVAIVTKIYADALRERRLPTKAEQKELEAAFSRDGFTQGYYLEEKGKAMFGRRSEEASAPQELFSKARERYGKGEQVSIPLSIWAYIQADEPISLIVSDEDGNAVTVSGAIPEAARNRAITREQIETQLSKTGGTVFAVDTITVDLDEGLSLPLSTINALRRQALDKLTNLRSAIPTRSVFPFQPPKRRPNPDKPPQITLSVRDLGQLSPALLSETPSLVYLPVEEVAQHPEAVAAYQKQYSELQFAVSLPRIVWDQELPELEQQLTLCRDLGITDALIGTWGLLPLCQKLGFRLRGDFGLGVYNSLTLEELSRLGFVSATASFELNFAQIRDLSKVMDTELLAYGRLSMMLTENCLLQNASGDCTCHTPAHLTDRKGVSFPVVKAYGCRSEILNANTLYLADKQEDYRALGLWAARLAFTTESAEDCVSIMQSYLGKGANTPEHLTRGLYYRKVE